MKITFDTDAIRMITLFENITGAPVKDCIIQKDNVYFLVEEGKIGIAIGKNGNSVKNAENLIKKNIKIFEFTTDLNSFVKKLIPQATGIRVRNESERVIVEVKVDRKNKAMVIGREGKNLKIFKDLLTRNHKIDELMVR